MTKSLTEKWRDGTLPLGIYYILNINGVEEIDKSVAIGELWNNTDLKEVLSPVPAYNVWKNIHEQWKVAIPQIERLEKQLAIAKKALEEYDNKLNWDIRGVSFMKYNKGFTIARKALKEMEGVK